MSIYTKTGDTGTTALYGGKRVSKADIQVVAYGDVDELTSYLGLVVCKLSDENKANLITIQNELYQIMAVLAGAKNDLATLDYAIPLFEKKIDEVEITLPKLTRFIIPGGTEVSALFQIVRTICRRAERSVVTLKNNQEENECTNFIIKYLNRLSDLLFTYARLYGKDHEIVT